MWLLTSQCLLLRECQRGLYSLGPAGLWYIPRQAGMGAFCRGHRGCLGRREAPGWWQQYVVEHACEAMDRMNRYTDLRTANRAPESPQPQRIPGFRPQGKERGLPQCRHLPLLAPPSHRYPGSAHRPTHLPRRHHRGPAQGSPALLHPHLLRRGCRLLRSARQGLPPG